MSLRSIAEIIGANNVTILQWMRSISKHVKETILSQTIEVSESLDVIEINEMWHCVEKNSRNYRFCLLTLVPKEEVSPVKSVLVAPKH